MSYVITIDGPAGAGKSSVSKRLAEKLGILYLDTGAIYRAAGLFLNNLGIKPEDDLKIAEAMKNFKLELKNNLVFLNNHDITHEIRTAEVDNLASVYSADKAVREALFQFQREQKNYGSLIAEGRDVGSVIFPDAEFKFFLTATPEARAKRRFLERQSKGVENNNYDEILKAIISRDEHDSKRELSPLKIPDGAILIDTSFMNEDEVIERLLSLVESVI